MAKIDIRFDFPSDSQIDGLLNVVGQMEKYKASDKMVAAMARVILARARQLVPHGTQTDRDARSSAQKAAADWESRLYRSIAMAVRKTTRLAYAVVGPSWPKGSKAYFNVAYKKGSRAVWYWGKNMGFAKPAIRNWLLQAADETKSQQIQAAKTALVKFLKDAYG